jgi:hypothetical protein
MSLRDVLKDDTQPYLPDRELTEAAQSDPVVMTLAVEGLGGISDYSLRIEIPAFDDYLRQVANIISQVNFMVFSLNWEEEQRNDGAAI